VIAVKITKQELSHLRKSISNPKKYPKNINPTLEIHN
jgi:hypothetical protein